MKHLNKLQFAEFVILVHVSFLEDFRHDHGHVHVTRVHPDLDEEGHHVKKLLNADIPIAILVKQIEHLKR